ncbi:MAG: hypothetical protein HC819_02500 [Cyclobacteriaceae bacterium]|nr:hypothetical protein [Cyclobacteriaceae bacterium]
MADKWWLSLVKLFSLTSGISSFLLIWLFYSDRQENHQSTCNPKMLALFIFIILVTSLVYFLVMKSQLTIRRKELFWRKYYGETQSGIVRMLMLETLIFIVAAFLMSLVIIDQVAPIFNLITDKNISIRKPVGWYKSFTILGFISVLGFIVGICPAFWYAKSKTSDMI